MFDSFISPITKQHRPFYEINGLMDLPKLVLFWCLLSRNATDGRPQQVQEVGTIMPQKQPFFPCNIYIYIYNVSAYLILRSANEKAN